MKNVDIVCQFDFSECWASVIACIGSGYDIAKVFHSGTSESMRTFFIQGNYIF